ncbi:MAG: hypothetical protein RIQ79_2010 [Verrucomicrobiota bacterium]|jgi:anti-sigma factor RsiW
MKYRLMTLVLLLALAAGAGAVSYYCLGGSTSHMSASDDSLVWLRSEFKLNNEQMRRIEALHLAYQDVCADHCAAIGEARGDLRELKTAGAPETRIREAETKLTEVDTACRSSTEAHARAVAAIMGEEQGARYLAVVLPRLAHVDHTGAPDLQANSAGAHHGN